MRILGCQVDVMDDSIKDYDYDEKFIDKMKKKCNTAVYDCIFSFNYFPVISRIANDIGIRYISWVFDSPHLTLDSVTLSNECNAVFLFDYCLYEGYCRKGIKTVYYMPLAYNKPRIEQMVQNITPHYEHEVTFLGKLYNDEFDFFGQIKYLPPKLRGYIEGVMEAQLLIYGFDFCGELVGHEICEKIAKYVSVDMGNQYIDYRDELFRNMIRKRITVMERRRLLSMIGNRYPLDLYAPKKPENIRLSYKGYVDYMEQMPQVFYTSKINLNITLRSILSGIPLRVIDILGAHGFLITNYQQELPVYFADGKDLVWFEDKEDLMDKIAFYLSHDSERERITQNGNRIVQEQFTYQNLLPKIFCTAMND